MQAVARDAMSQPPAPTPPTTTAAPMLSEAEQLARFPNTILVSKRQEGNPILKYIRNVRWQFADITPDYLAGPGTAILFLSLRFHLLKPTYMYGRMKALQRAYRLRVLLCFVDTEDAVGPLEEVIRASIGLDCTLICAFSPQECARYIETFKSYENKPADAIQKSIGSDFVSTATAALTTIRGINKTDVKTLGDRFGSIAELFQASQEQLSLCPGLGPTKVRRLVEAFQEPFRNTLSARIEDRPGTGTSRGTSALPLSPEQTNEPSSSSDPHPAESSQPSKADVMELNDDSDDAEAFL